VIEALGSYSGAKLFLHRRERRFNKAVKLASKLGADEN
jgi:hypothetical protein